MTRKEAIDVLSNFTLDFRQPGCFEAMEAIKIAIHALRPIGREQVEKMKKEPAEGKCEAMWEPTYACPECGFVDVDKWNFCRNCGCPYTEEAVQMVMERMEGLYDTKN